MLSMCNARIKLEFIKIRLKFFFIPQTKLHTKEIYNIQYPNALQSVHFIFRYFICLHLSLVVPENNSENGH